MMDPPAGRAPEASARFRPPWPRSWSASSFPRARRSITSKLGGRRVMSGWGGGRGGRKGQAAPLVSRAPKRRRRSRARHAPAHDDQVGPGPRPGRDARPARRAAGAGRLLPDLRPGRQVVRFHRPPGVQAQQSIDCRSRFIEHDGSPGDLGAEPSRMSLHALVKPLTSYRIAERASEGRRGRRTQGTPLPRSGVELPHGLTRGRLCPHCARPPDRTGDRHPARPEEMDQN